MICFSVFRHGRFIHIEKVYLMSCLKRKNGKILKYIKKKTVAKGFKLRVSIVTGLHSVILSSDA